MLSDSTLEFGQARLKAKSSLRFTMRKTGSRVTYIVEDELTGKFFQIGLAQYTFISMLDGQRTVNSALQKTASLLRQHAFDQQQVADLCKWAIESGLVETEAGSSTASREKVSSNATVQHTKSLLNPISIKIPLFCPDASIAAATRFCGWLISPAGAMLWLLVVGYGFFQLLLHSDQFFQNRTAISANDILWFAVAWLLLKLVHEMAHGLVCKKFGGRVSSCGMLLLLLIPLPYVDVTSSWRFDNKWQRILTSAAGMMCEIFIAAIACIVWANCSPGPLQYHAGNVIITATLHTLLFNANPLMKFDGYFILSDWLEIPNLQGHGKRYVKSFFKRIYFGAKSKPVSEVGLRGLAVKAYGFGAIAWFFLISIGLSLGASSLLEGFGFLIAMIGIFMWFGMPVIAFVKYVAVGTKFEQPDRRWFATAAAITVLIVSGFLFACPSPSVVSAPVVIDYEPLSTIRAQASGFAKTIHVTEGQHVEAGDLLVTLENRELEAEYKSLMIDLKISQLRIKSLLLAQEIASIQLEEETLASLEKRRIELERLLAHLETRATESGTVLTSELASKQGTYLRPGDEILSIGNTQQIQAVALIKQEDAPWLSGLENSDVDVALWGDPEKTSVQGTLAHINPRARDDLPHEAFAAANGGPLAVVNRNQVEGGENDETTLMLTSPRVKVEIELPPAEQQRLLAGQSGLLILRGRDETMAQYLANGFVRFVRKNNFRTHGL